MEIKGLQGLSSLRRLSVQKCTNLSQHGGLKNLESLIHMNVGRDNRLDAPSSQETDDLVEIRDSTN